MNPYQILGISPSASDDEVKKAYRTLSKKYHPDANIGNPHQAEYTEKFKEVQNAYKTIMDERKRGFKQQSYGSQTTGTGGYQYQGNDQEAYQEANGFIQGRRYQEALNVLNQIQNKTSMWFYLAAIAENGLGNNIRAQEYAQTALQMPFHPSISCTTTELLVAGSALPSQSCNRSPVHCIIPCSGDGKSIRTAFTISNNRTHMIKINRSVFPTDDCLW